MGKTNPKQNVREACLRSPSPLINQLNNEDHLMSKEPLNNNDKVSNSTRIPSIVSNMIHASMTHNDKINDTANTCSTNNNSPNEEICTRLVGQLDDTDANKAIDDSVLVRSIGTPIFR